MAPKDLAGEYEQSIYALASRRNRRREERNPDGGQGCRTECVPPMVVGGHWRYFEKCALMAKKALTRPVDEHSEIPREGTGRRAAGED